MGDEGGLDINLLSEEEIESRLAIYLVRDSIPPVNSTSSKSRAEWTLPQNLEIKETKAQGQPNNVSYRSLFLSVIFQLKLRREKFRS